MARDYYIVLGVSRGADAKKIKKAYRTIAKKYHPDLVHSEKDSEKFREIKEAYETLRDEEKRRAYDAHLEGRGSELRLTRAPEIIRSRRAPIDDMERFFSEADDFFSGFVPGFFEMGGKRPGKKDWGQSSEL